jgi:hypothetical protein
LPRNKENNDGVVNFLFGMLIGAAGYTILSFLAKPKCPICKKEIKRYASTCSNCETKLTWK